MKTQPSTWLCFLRSALMLAVFSTPASSHDQVPGRPQSQPVLIQGGTLHVASGQDVLVADLLFEDGRITKIGRKIKSPQNTKVIDASGKQIYPGLIESMTDLGLREISAVDVTVDRTERGNNNPNARSWIAINPDSELIPVARAGGVLMANVAPGGRYLRGQSAVIQLDGWTTRDMTLLAPSGLCMDWDYLTPRGSDDADMIKQREQKLQGFEQLLDQAKRYGEAKVAAEQSGKASLFPTDLQLESLLPVIHGKLPVIAEADGRAAIESAVAFAQTHRLKLIIFVGYDAERCASLLRLTDTPVIVDATYRNPRRRDDAYDASFTLPARLKAAGIRFAIGGEGSGSPNGAANTRNLPYHAGCAVAYGLDHATAVRSITLAPAEILGVADRVGSLDIEKDATLIIADGDILESNTHVERAFIQGRDVDLGSRHKTLFEKYRRKYKAAD